MKRAGSSGQPFSAYSIAKCGYMSEYLYSDQPFSVSSRLVGRKSLPTSGKLLKSLCVFF